MDQLHAQHGARPQQLRADERRTAIDQNRHRERRGHQARAQRGLEPEDVLAGAPPPPDQKPAVVIDERQQHRPSWRAAGQIRPMEPVPRPQLIPRRRLETTVDLPDRAAVPADVEPLPREMRLQRPQPQHLLTITRGRA